MRIHFAAQTHAAKCAKALKQELTGKSDQAKSLLACQNLMAIVFGYRHWHELAQSCGRMPASLSDAEVPEGERIDRRAQMIERLRQAAAISSFEAAAIIIKLDPLNWSRPQPVSDAGYQTALAAVRQPMALSATDVPGESFLSESFLSESLPAEDSPAEDLGQPISSSLLCRDPFGWASQKILQLMQRAGLLDLEGKGFGALGRGPANAIRAKHLSMTGSQSLLCVGRPGEMKSLGLVVPTILSADEASLVIFDVKSELLTLTASHRSTVSKVLMLNWLQPDPEDSQETASGPAVPEAVTAVRFNFLSPKLVPPPGPRRALYIAGIAKSFVPERIGGDPYFFDRARLVLAGLIDLLLVRVADAGDVSFLPAAWQDKEVSFPMLVSWLTAGFLHPAGGRPKSGTDDLVAAWFRDLAALVDPAKSGKGRSQQAFDVCLLLANMADKERSGVIGTLFQALLPFRSKAACRNTMTCDFDPDDLRGMFDPALTARTHLPEDHPDFISVGSVAFAAMQANPANWRSLTLYICIDQASAPMFASLTACLLDILSWRVMQNPLGLNARPSYKFDRGWRKFGSYPVAFLIDEMGKLPKVESFIEAPSMGPAMAVSYVFVAQSFAEIEKAYGKNDAEKLQRNCAVKALFNQHARPKRNTFNKIDMTLDPALEQADFLRNQDLIYVPRGQHVLLVEGFMKWLVRVKTKTMTIGFRDL